MYVNSFNFTLRMHVGSQLASCHKQDANANWSTVALASSKCTPILALQPALHKKRTIRISLLICASKRSCSSWVVVIWDSTSRRDLLLRCNICKGHLLVNLLAVTLGYPSTLWMRVPLLDILKRTLIYEVALDMMIARW